MNKQITLERDLSAKCWTAVFWGFERLPNCKLPLPYTVDADLYQVAYALRDQYGPVDIINKVNGRRYSVYFTS